MSIDLDELPYLRDEDVPEAIVRLIQRLPESRKLTWEMVDEIRDAGHGLDSNYPECGDLYRALERIADVLASYLPPRTP